MGTYKGPTEGGSGGKRGHSNMEHWVTTEEIKESTKSLRRNNDKKEINSAMNNYRNESNQLTIDFDKIESKMYLKITKEVVKKYNLETNKKLVIGFNEKFQEFKLGKAIIGLEWDNWSGYIVNAKNKEAENLVKEIAEFINEKY